MATSSFGGKRRDAASTLAFRDVRAFGETSVPNASARILLEPKTPEFESFSVSGDSFFLSGDSFSLNREMILLNR